MHKYAFLVIVPLGFAFVSFSELFLRFFFGKEFVFGSLAFQIVLVGTIFIIIGQINNSVISGIGKPKAVTKIILISAIVNVLTNLIFIPKFGIEGAALATSFSYLLLCVLSILEIRKFMEFKAPILDWSKTFFSGLIFVLVIFFLRKIININPLLELIVILIMASAVYVVLVFILRIISLQEIKKITLRVLKR